MPADNTRNPDEIEREIRATQRDMSDTVNQLEAQLTPRNLLNSLLDKADQNGIDTRYLLDTARRNPLALGMIAVGGIWLVSDNDARLTSLKPNGASRSGFGGGYDADDGFHRGYVEHMGRIEHQPEEDLDTYRRRRDYARGSYLMIEQRHDEDEHAFRDRLDKATDRLRERREQMADSARELAQSAYEGASNIARQTSDQTEPIASKVRRNYDDNPLLGGLFAAFAGALAGGAIPVSRTEEEQFGRMGARALDQARDTARQAGEDAREKKDELVDRADRQVRESEPPGDGSAEQADRAQEFDRR